MSNFGKFADVAVDLKGYVATVEIQRPPHNYFDVKLVRSLVEAFRALADAEGREQIRLRIAGYCGERDRAYLDTLRDDVDRLEVRLNILTSKD